MPLTKSQKIEAEKVVKSNKITELTVAFIRMTSDKNMRFINAGTEEEAKKIVQCMRVKLSRMRAEIKSKGGRSKEFKMNLKSYEFNEKTNETEIVLTKLAPSIRLKSELDDLYNTLPEVKKEIR